MRVMMTILCTVWAVALISCIDDDDRCGDLKWEETNLWCAGEMDTSTAVVDTTGPGTDTATDSMPAPILGEVCNSDADCAQYNANYCLPAQGQDNFCTLKNCSATPNNCPSGYSCCVISPGTGYETHCMPNETYTTMGAQICEQ
jgi:hypothetical protein